MENELNNLIKRIETLPLDEKVEALNTIKIRLHEISPFKNEPVDCVIWKKGDEIVANNYNPNKVAPPEMELLKLSILKDGYTQPIVSNISKNGKYVVVDGFHRNRVGKEDKDINKKIHGYLPITVIREIVSGRGDRITSTIRHNRARGKHTIDGMSEIILELKRRNWSNKKIRKELGMDEDEILRLYQITGLKEMFEDKEFNKSWEIEQINEDDDLDKDKEGK